MAAVAARALAVAVPLAVAGGGVLLVLDLFSGVPFTERVAWTPVVVLLAAPVVIALERSSAWMLTLADLLRRPLEFADPAPSRLAVAWAAATPRQAEERGEFLARRMFPPGAGAGAEVVAVIAGLERHHPRVRARLAGARRCAEALADEMGLPDVDRRLAEWLVSLRLGADAAGPGDLDRWLEAAFRAVPGVPHVPSQAKRVGALAGFAVEFGILCAAPPHGLGVPPGRARRMLVEAGTTNVAPEVVGALRRLPDEALVGGPRRPRPRPQRAPAGTRAPLPRRVALAPALAMGTAVALAVVLAGGRTGESELPSVLGRTEVNAAPRPVPDTAAVRDGETVTIDVVGNDRDPDGDPLSLERFGGARLGTAERAGDGEVRYTAFSPGTDRFVYSVSDGHGGEAEGVVTVTVEP